jgi:hypothetical protein
MYPSLYNGGTCSLLKSQLSTYCTSSSEGQSGFENQHPDSCAGFLKRREGKSDPE